MRFLYLCVFPNKACVFEKAVCGVRKREEEKILFFGLKKHYREFDFLRIQSQESCIFVLPYLKDVNIIYQ